ncbi:MAG: DUF5519 family protein, partial [Thermoproteota archaeon]|nr:DUF5519 family protein [Thermoproteota archaeon]
TCTTHHVLPQSGRVSYWLRDEDNIPAVIELFQLQYQHLNPKSEKEYSESIIESNLNQ